MATEGKCWSNDCKAADCLEHGWIHPQDRIPETITLSPEVFDKMVEAIQNPKPPTDVLLRMMRNLPDWHYYEAHVTIKPLKYPQDYVDLESLCRKNAFRPAKLLMQKDGRLEENDKDMFCSARSQERQDILDRTLAFVQDLMDFGFAVYRYKIESTLVDSREDMSLLQIAGEPTEK